MFCAAIRENDESKWFRFRRTAEDVNIAFEVLKEGNDES